MNEPQQLSQLTISYYENVERGLFAPQEIEVWGGADKDHLKKLGQVRPVLPNEKRPAMKDLITIKFPEQSVQCVRLIAKCIDRLPSYVKVEKDTKPALFVDEVGME